MQSALSPIQKPRAARLHLREEKRRWLGVHHEHGARSGTPPCHASDKVQDVLPP